MTVELIAMTTPLVGDDRNPMSVVEQCASVCYDSNPTDNYRIAESCYKSGHTSVWEHISFTFHISGVSRALLAQLTRHRIASYTVRSQRYCVEDNFGFVEPRFKNKEFLDPYRDMMALTAETYSSLVREGENPEDARFILPNSCVTELYVTMNARELINSSGHRLCSRAQWEIRNLFQEMKERVNAVCPQVADKMRPSCERDMNHPFCTEMRSCGRHPKLKDVYRKD